VYVFLIKQEQKIMSKFAASFTAFILLLTAAPIFAHHSFSAEFDGDKEQKLVGVLTKVDWINPHSYWYMDVKAADGTIEHWAIESLSPGEWHSAKVTKDMVGKPGETVTADVFLARDGTKHLAWSTKFTFSDGHSIEATCPRGR